MFLYFRFPKLLGERRSLILAISRLQGPVSLNCGGNLISTTTIPTQSLSTNTSANSSPRHSPVTHHHYYHHSSPLPSSAHLHHHCCGKQPQPCNSNNSKNSKNVNNSNNGDTPCGDGGFGLGDLESEGVNAPPCCGGVASVPFCGSGPQRCCPPVEGIGRGAPAPHLVAHTLLKHQRQNFRRRRHKEFSSQCISGVKFLH